MFLDVLHLAAGTRAMEGASLWECRGCRSERRKPTIPLNFKHKPRSHSSTAAALQALRDMAAAGGAIVRVCAALRGRSKPYHISKLYRAYCENQTTEHTHLRTSSPFHTGTPLFPLFSFRHPRDFKSQVTNIPTGSRRTTPPTDHLQIIPTKRR